MWVCCRRLIDFRVVCMHALLDQSCFVHNSFQNWFAHHVGIHASRPQWGLRVHYNTAPTVSIIQPDWSINLSFFFEIRRFACDDSGVILFTDVAVAMHLVGQMWFCSVLSLHLATCADLRCAIWISPVEIHHLRITLAHVFLTRTDMDTVNLFTLVCRRCLICDDVKSYSERRDVVWRATLALLCVILKYLSSCRLYWLSNMII